jgi:hypothetical protein
MKRVAAVTIALGLLAGAPARGAAGSLSAAEIVARNEAARGGLEAWRKVETMVWIGHVESARAPAPRMPFELDQKRPNRTRLQLDAMSDRSFRVFDGTRGFKVRSIQGRPQVQPYSPQELLYARAGHGIDGPLIDSAAKGTTVTLEGEDEVEGRRAHHLKVHLAAGGAEEVWVDAETFLDVRYDRFADGPGGATRRVSVRYGDWRTVDGLKLPFLIETGGAPGTTPDRMRLERVMVNARLEDTRFATPAGPRPSGDRARMRIALPSGAPTGAGAPRGATSR